MALEPTCLALLTLRSDTFMPAEILIDNQRCNGGWPSFARDDQSSGLTGLALLTLNSFGIAPDARKCAVRWLLRTRGKEASWPLHACDRSVDRLQRRLGCLARSEPLTDIATLAIAVLALDCTGSGNPFKLPE